MLNSILMAGNESRGATPSTLAERSWVLGGLGLNTVRANMRTMMNSSMSRRSGAPSNIRQRRLLICFMSLGETCSCSCSCSCLFSVIFVTTEAN